MRGGSGRATAGERGSGRAAPRARAGNNRPSDAANRRPVSSTLHAIPRSASRVTGRAVKPQVSIRSKCERSRPTLIDTPWKVRPDRTRSPTDAILRPRYVDTGCALASGSPDGALVEHVDDGLLQRLDNPPHPDPRTVQVVEQVRHELPRPVVGHLPSPIGTNHGNRSGSPHVAASARLPEREDGRVLEQPQLIGRFQVPRFRVRSHRLHRVAVRHAPQPVDEERPHYSNIRRT